MREKYDDEYLNKLKQDWTYTSDKKTLLPPRSKLYDPQAQEPKVSFRIKTCVMFFDTDIERKIGVGRNYNYSAMNEGECLVNDNMASKLKI